ncbi:hypothetical protein GW17_00031231 [Ensete ventricosum]|nr:hypothetical protein GW17_00031231 [Ensete ventricosum]
MAATVEKIGDFYAVLGLRKECSEAELRIAYKKLAMNGHDSFEELQRMFLDMFQDDLNAGFGDSPIYSGPQARPTDGLNCSMMPSGPQFADGGSNGSNKRGNSGKANLDGLENSATGFCFGVSD